MTRRNPAQRRWQTRSDGSTDAVTIFPADDEPITNEDRKFIQDVCDAVAPPKED